MRVTCLQENLSKGLSLVSRAVATQSTLPVLQNVLLRTDSAQLKLSATNLEISVSCWVGAKVEEHGALTVPARLLSGLVRSLPADRVEMVATARTKSLRLICGQHEANIKGIDAVEFPAMPDLSGVTAIPLDPDELATMIAQIVPAAAVDESRPVLTGVLLRLSGRVLTLVASDGFRLAVRKAELAQLVHEPVEVIIPAQAMREVGQIAADEKDFVRLSISTRRNQALFRGTNAELLSQLLEGRYPNYQRFVPREHATRAVVETRHLADAIKLSLFFARDSANIVKLHIVPGEDGDAGRIDVSAASAQSGDNASRVYAQIVGDEETIAFDARYLSDLLGVINSDALILETSTPTSPAIIRPLGDQDYTYVIVPIMVY
jgi:DNA polymerase III subunit beta